MALTPKGVYFPEGTARADFVETFNNIAQSVDDALGDFTYDSGWIDVPNSQLSNGWQNYNTTSYQFSYRRVGKLVACKGLLRNGTLGNLMFTFPLGFRPPGTAYFTSESRGHITDVVNIYVSSNGQMYTRSSGDGSSVSWVPVTAIHYFTDNNT